MVRQDQHTAINQDRIQSGLEIGNDCLPFFRGRVRINVASIDAKPTKDLCQCMDVSHAHAKYESRFPFTYCSIRTKDVK